MTGEMRPIAPAGSDAPPLRPRPTLAECTAAVAAWACLTERELLARTRRQPIARTRQVLFYLAATLTARSLPWIGARLGGFDHTTVLYGRDAVAARMKQDGGFRAEVQALERLLLEHAASRSARRSPTELETPSAAPPAVSTKRKRAR